MAQKRDGENFIKIVGIGVIIYLLMRKKIAPALRKAAGGGTGSGSGSGMLFAASKLPLQKRSKIAAKVKSSVQSLNIVPIADDWQDSTTQYNQDIKQCRI